MDSWPRSSRNEIFQELKPRCVELSQLALRDDGSTDNYKALVESASQLLATLQQICQRSGGAFDEKLADYVFFPLSRILRRSQKYTDSLSELTIKCVRILLEYGWRKSIGLDLAKQLLILFTFIAGGVPGKQRVPVPEEVIVEAYGALAALFQDIATTTGGAASLAEPATIPALGHCVAVIIQAATDGPSREVQLQALIALDAVWSCIKDPQALSGFFPGTISGLTKCLTPSTGTRRSRKTILKALEVLGHVLTSLLGDIQTRNTRNDISIDPPKISYKHGGTEVPLGPSWLMATTGQIKLALSNIVRLRSHESLEVRKALNRLCITVLDECHDTLADSALLLVETSMTLSEADSKGDLSDNTTTLQDLASIYPELSELVKTSLYNAITTLPTVMQANDQSAKLAALNRLSKAHEILSRLNMQSTILEHTLGESIRDSITVMLEPISHNGFHEAELDLSSEAALMLMADNSVKTLFQPVVMSQESQKQVKSQLTTVLANLGDTNSQIKLASKMLEYARDASGPSCLSAYWLSFQVLKSATLANKDIEEFTDFSFVVSDYEALAQQIFSYSTSILTSDLEENSDWRMQAVALEVVADTAQRMEKEFRTELVDTIYPVAQLLGSSNSRVREHAITSLNIISRSCGYVNTSDMIVDNVDYMVNAISLRLNTFDISPQVPQVLVMILRLTGPSILLYLDDVVRSIFGALDNFHGYHRILEILLTVLEEIVRLGSSLQDLPNFQDDNFHEAGLSVLTIEDIMETFSPKSSSDRNEFTSHENFPHTPWKSARTLLNEMEAEQTEDQKDEEPVAMTHSPSPSKIYTMIQSITRLSQNHLTSASPILRAKLLGLITSSSVLLRNDEDSFLPLINDIWPVVIKRLYDEETFVKIAAANTVAELCRSAKNFLSSRLETEWPELFKMAKQAQQNMARERKGNGRRGIYSQDSQVWEATIRLLTAIIASVRMNDAIIDQIFGLLENIIYEREEIKIALGRINSDAMWLSFLNTRKISKPEIPCR